jgi:flagellar biosynthesis protein FlhA
MIPRNPILAAIHRHRAMLFPLACIGLLMVLLVPLPRGVLDLLLVINLALSVIVLVTTIYVHSPLEFAVFPSLLLAITLFRLVLNVATTRLILTGGGSEFAAGDVVHAFAEFVTAGSLAVGFILFLIIFVIQFVVITKGGGRISEVAARFMLDALPGKQMAIDADLAAGAITEPQARQRRQDVAQQADFYGAMDGASRFVRGDAIAAVVITIVNILGGLYVGMFEHGMPLADCLAVYTKLTIGDGLVSQIPAFIVSLGAGLIVTRSAAKSDLGEQVIGQMLARPAALMIAAAFLAVLAVLGMPVLPLLIVGGTSAALAVVLTRRRSAADDAAGAAKDLQLLKEPEVIEKLLDVQPMELILGHGLIRLAEAEKGGDLMDRIVRIRRQIASELGVIVPSVRIGDEDGALGVNDYLIRMKSQPVARGVSYPEQFLAIDRGDAVGAIAGGEVTSDPSSEHLGYWITDSQSAEAAAMGYAVINAGEVVANHVAEVIRTHAHELLTRQATRELLDHLKQSAPALVEEVVPAQVKPAELQRVLQNLLRERVPVRDLETILETLGDQAGRAADIEQLSERVRAALARTICRQYVDAEDRLWCITLDPSIEAMIGSNIERGERPTRAEYGEDKQRGEQGRPGERGQRGEQASVSTLPPRTARRIAELIEARVIEATQTLGHRPIVLCAPQVRAQVRRVIESSLPRVAVLSYGEITQDVHVEAMGFVGDEPGSVREQSPIAADSGDAHLFEDGYESANV